MATITITSLRIPYVSAEVATEEYVREVFARHDLATVGRVIFTHYLTTFDGAPIYAAEVQIAKWYNTFAASEMKQDVFLKIEYNLYFNYPRTWLVLLGEGNKENEDVENEDVENEDVENEDEKENVVDLENVVDKENEVDKEVADDDFPCEGCELFNAGLGGENQMSHSCMGY